MGRLELLGLTFALHPDKLVVARVGTARPAHVTLSWNNASGEVDLHLKHDPSVPGEQPVYGSLLKIRRESLTEAGQRIVEAATPIREQVVQEWKPVTPEWLWFRRYALVVPAQAEFIEALRAVIPKAKRKYRLPGATRLAQDPALRDATLRYFRPSVLRELAGPDVIWPLYAVPLRGRGGLLRPVLVIGRVKREDGSAGWIRLPQSRAAHLLDPLVAAMVRLVAAAIRPEHVAIWDRIVAALDLTGIPELCYTVGRVRAILVEPQLLVESHGRP